MVCGLLTLGLFGTLYVFPRIWAKTDFEPLPAVTQVEILSYGESRGMYPPPPLESEKVPALIKFIDGQRSGWTGPFLGTFELPHPFVRADLYDDKGYIGYFAVGAAVLPGSHAVFEVRRGNVRARKRVTKSEANQFFDLIGNRW